MMIFVMRLMFKNKMKSIDIGLVKYTTRDVEEEYFDNIYNYFNDLNFNVIVHDNNENNIGLVKARNSILKQSQSKYITFCDFDIDVIKIDWDKIIEKFEQDETVGIISPITDRFSTVKKDIEWQEKEYLSCNFLIMNRFNLNKIGGFDENFFVAYGDWDLKVRFMKNGFKLYQHNLSKIKHFGFSRHNHQKGPIWRKDFNTFRNKYGYSLNRSLK